ncbi:hypothetical protein HG531_010390 [Fusarium graminearum]|nr:hypothetical protein HG531_010390 [Fusarium graminearum]
MFIESNILNPVEDLLEYIIHFSVVLLVEVNIEDIQNLDDLGPSSTLVRRACQEACGDVRLHALAEALAHSVSAGQTDLPEEIDLLLNRPRFGFLQLLLEIRGVIRAPNLGEDFGLDGVHDEHQVISGLHVGGKSELR